MKKTKKFLVGLAIAILPLATAASLAHERSQEVERTELINFIEYCKTCENLRQVNPNKDYTKASLHELKSAAKFYVEQYDFADCTDYQNQKTIDSIINK